MKQEEKDMEVYKQRYETFRHLDRLKWQMLQLAVAIASAFGLITRFATHEFEWWIYAVFGFALLAIGWAMHTIGNGIRRNNEVLRSKGMAIGDQDIPDTSNERQSVSYWIAFFIMFIGIVLMAIPVFQKLM